MRKNWLWRYHEYINVKKSPVYEEKKDEAVKKFHAERANEKPNSDANGHR